MTTEFELHQKLRKYFKKIKIDPVYIELIQWKELEIVHPTIDITESLDIQTSCNFSEQNEAIEELEEPIMKPLIVPRSTTQLMPLPVVDFIVPPVISFTNNINIKFPRKFRNSFDSEPLMYFELPLISFPPKQSITNQPKLNELKIPLKLFTDPISLTIETDLLGSLDFENDDCLHEPQLESFVENTIATELELPILRQRLCKFHSAAIYKEMKVPNNLQGLYEVARRSYTSTQNLILKKESSYINSLIEEPTVSESPYFFIDPNVDELVSVLGIDQMIDTSNVSFKLSWNVFQSCKFLIPVKEVNLSKLILELQPAMESNTAKALQQLKSHCEIGFGDALWLDDIDFVSMAEVILPAEHIDVKKEAFIASNAIEKFLLLRGKAMPEAPKRVQPEPNLVIVNTETNIITKDNVTEDKAKLLYNGFAIQNNPVRHCVISSSLFRRKDLIKSLQKLLFEFCEREFSSEYIIIDCNTVCMLWKFNKLPHITDIRHLVKSEIGNSILANALHFKQIHLILESVSPEMALNNLKIDPFTPPVIKELEFYHVLATNILKPQFGSNLNIWYSDTDRQTAWIIRKCSDQSPCNMDWLKDIPSKQEQFLSLFPGINEASAQYLLSQHSIAEIARLDKETLLKFTDKIHASSLDTFYKYLH